MTFLIRTLWELRSEGGEAEKFTLTYIGDITTPQLRPI